MRKLSLVVLLMLTAPLAAQDMPLNLVLIPGEAWKPYTDKAFPADITSMVADSAGNVFVAIKGEKAITRLGLDGTMTALPVPNPVHGLALDSEDHLLATVPETGTIIVVGLANSVYKADLPKGIADLVITKNGTVYASIPEKDAIVQIPQGGKGEKMISGLAKPTGLQLWPKDETLVVGQAGGKHLKAFRIDQDGTPTYGENYYPLRVRKGKPAETGGLTMDRDQRIYAATTEGVQIFDPIGRLCGVVPPPLHTKPIAVAFGGSGRNLLLIACGKQIYALKTKASPLPLKP